MATPEQKAKAKTVRRCIATGEAIEATTPALRLVLGPDGVPVVDLKARLPGRGAWVHADRKALVAAIDRRCLARAFKGARLEAFDGDAFVAHAHAQIRQAVLGRLGLALRAGQLITGFEKVREGLKHGKVAVLVTASDGALDGRTKLIRTMRAHSDQTSLSPPVLGCFSGEKLSAATGTANFVHGGVRPGPVAAGLLGEMARLAGFEPVDTFSAD